MGRFAASLCVLALMAGACSASGTTGSRLVELLVERLDGDNDVASYSAIVAPELIVRTSIDLPLGGDGR